MWNDNIKVDLIEFACKVAALIETVQDGVRRIFFNSATYIRVS